MFLFERKRKAKTARWGRETFRQKCIRDYALCAQAPVAAATRGDSLGTTS